MAGELAGERFETTEKKEVRVVINHWLTGGNLERGKGRKRENVCHFWNPVQSFIATVV